MIGSEPDLIDSDRRRAIVIRTVIIQLPLEVRVHYASASNMNLRPRPGAGPCEPRRRAAASRVTVLARSDCRSACDRDE
jgi:hypothetical protein